MAQTEWMNPKEAAELVRQVKRNGGKKLSAGLAWAAVWSNNNTTIAVGYVSNGRVLVSVEKH